MRKALDVVGQVAGQLDDRVAEAVLRLDLRPLETRIDRRRQLGERPGPCVAIVIGEEIFDEQLAPKALTEKGDIVNGRGDTPNMHDILTGSQTDGRAYTDGADHTCKNWTSSADGTAQLGHFDRTGGGNTSWNAAHPSRGCSQDNLVSTGGAGLYYCFAVVQ